MLNPTFLLKPLAVAALLAASTASNATFTVYNSQSSFLAAVMSPGVDDYTGFSTTGPTPTPILRSAGTYSYTASTDALGFYGAGTAANPWLSTNESYDTITFNAFSGGVSAIGGNFFGADLAGAFLSGSILVTATDASGTVSQTISGATTSSFLGFVSSGPLLSFTVAAVQPGSGALWPSVDNLTLASAVPEPSTYALMFAGLGAIGAMTRRRQR